MSAVFNHEKLEVYGVARLFNREIGDLLEAVPRGHADSRDNLKRGAMSITRNIAEGSGKWAIKDKVNFYHIARGSATECAACLDELVDFGLVSQDRVQAPKQSLFRVVSMLTAMIRSLQSRTGSGMSG